MNQEDEIFRVTDKLGEVVVLTKQDWDRITAKRPDVSGHEDDVRETLESPTMVWEGRYADTKVFHKKGLLEDDPLHKACLVAVAVRYPTDGSPGTIRTVYFPFHVQGRLGRLLDADL
jgi:hypothetical protein